MKAANGKTGALGLRQKQLFSGLMSPILHFWGRCRFTWLKLILLLLGLSACLVMLAISRGSGQAHYYFFRQLRWFCLGSLLFLFISTLSSAQLRRWTPLLLFLAPLSLGLVLLFGAEVNGMRGWFRFGDYTIQPAELLKPLFILFFAWFWERQEESLSSWSVAFASFSVLSVWVGLIILQPDFGTALVYVLTFVGMYWGMGAAWRQLTLMGSAALLAAVLAVWKHPYLLERFRGFLSRDAAFLSGGGWQAARMRDCLIQGGWFGVFFHDDGVLVGVPYRMNDSLFACLAEQLGFIGILPLILLCLAWFWSCCYYYWRSSNRFQQAVYLGAGLMLSGQAFIHLAVNLSLMPTTGINLPLLSYGGSSLFATLMIVALVDALGIENNDAPILKPELRT